MAPPEPARGVTRLWIVRHGESAGNVARDQAHERDADRIDLPARDVDIALSPAGERQARALGAWFAAAPAGDRPDLLLVSPYVRAQETARLFVAAGGAAADTRLHPDERLREKEFGILDGLTYRGVRRLYPEQARLRAELGKFYHRPPGGESWCDVILRLRSALDHLAIRHAGRRVMIVAHQVVVLCLRTIIEELSEAEILAIDRAGDVANASVTEYRREGERLVLTRYNDVAPLAQAPAAAPVTAEIDPTPEPQR